MAEGVEPSGGPRLSVVGPPGGASAGGWQAASSFLGSPADGSAQAPRLDGAAPEERSSSDGMGPEHRSSAGAGVAERRSSEESATAPPLRGASRGDDGAGAVAPADSFFGSVGALVSAASSDPRAGSDSGSSIALAAMAEGARVFGGWVPRRACLHDRPAGVGALVARCVRVQRACRAVRKIELVSWGAR